VLKNQTEDRIILMMKFVEFIEPRNSMEEAMSDEIEIVISQENNDEILDYLTMTRKCLFTKIKTSFP
jgi:hypothetical protein